MIASVLRWFLGLPSIILEWLDSNVYKNLHHIASVVALCLLVYATVKLVNSPQGPTEWGVALIATLAGLVTAKFGITGYVHMRKEETRIKNGAGHEEHPAPPPGE